MDRERFRTVVRTALEDPAALLRVAIPTPAFVVVIASGDAYEEVLIGIEEVIQALGRDGSPPGRVVALLPTTREGRPAVRRALALRSRLALPVMAHDPESSPCFVAGRSPEGVGIELDDELREAEAIVQVAGPFRGMDGTSLPPLHALVPGLLSGATRRALESSTTGGSRSWAEWQERLGDLLPTDFTLSWRRETDGSLCAHGTLGTDLDPHGHRG